MMFQRSTPLHTIDLNEDQYPSSLPKTITTTSSTSSVVSATSSITHINKNNITFRDRIIKDSHRMNRKERISTIISLIILTCSIGVILTQMFSVDEQHVNEIHNRGLVSSPPLASPSPPPAIVNLQRRDDRQYEQQTARQEEEEEDADLDESISNGVSLQGRDGQQYEQTAAAAAEAGQEEENKEEEDEEFTLPFDIRQRMREWLAKKALSQGYFFTPRTDETKAMKPYSANEIINTIPHFTRELLLVIYAASTDEFIVLLPGKANRPPPKCEAGCVRIENIMHAILFAFRNRYPQRFQGTKGNSQDLLFLVSTGDSPRLSRDCYARPGGCGRRKKFAPILHFGSGFVDETILPSLVIMPPPPRIHLRCMAEWQIHHEICEYLLPKKQVKDPNGNTRETMGLIFGEHVNYNVNGSKKKDNRTEDQGIFWEDLIPQVVWRGTDFPYLALLHPEMRSPDYKLDVKPKEGKYGRNTQGVIHALQDVYDTLRPRWKAVLLTAQAEYDVNNKNKRKNSKKNQRQQQNGDDKVLPWANMKFSAVVNSNHVKTAIEDNEYYQKWTKLGIPATGEPMSSEELAKYKYHIDLGGGAGTSWEGTIQKLAMPGLLFHHVTATQDWYHEHLMPYVHYIPIKEDLSDLKEKVEWAESHDRKARYIAKQGTDFVRRMGRPEGLDELYRKHLLKPLEDIINNWSPIEEMPMDFLARGDLIFKEVMRCSGHNIDECPLLH